MTNLQKKTLRKTVVDVVCALVGLVLLTMVLTTAQTSLSMSRQRENSQIKLDLAVQRLEQHEEEADDNLTSYDEFSQAKVNTVGYMLNRNPELDVAAFATQWGLTKACLFDASGSMTTLLGNALPAFDDTTGLGTITEDMKPVTVENTRYYAVQVNGGVLVGGRLCQEEKSRLEALRAPYSSLFNIKVGSAGYIFAIDLETGTVVYHPDSRWSGHAASAVGYDYTAYGDGYTGWVDCDGVRMYAMVREANGLLLTAVIPKAELDAYNHQVVGLSAAVFAIIIFLVVAYALMIRHDQAVHPTQSSDYVQLGKHFFFDKIQFVKVRNIGMIALVAVFIFSYYLQTLSSLSHQSIRSNAKLDAVTVILDANTANIEDLTQEYADEYSQRARNIAYTIGEDPTLVDDDRLSELSESACISAIYVFDKKGKTVATNTNYKDFEISEDENSQSYPFWSVVKGYTDLVIQDAQPDDTFEHKMVQYVGVKRLDAKGMVQLGVLPRRLKGRLATTQLDYVLNSIAVENGGYLFAVNKTSSNVVSYPKSGMIGEAYSEIGLSEAALHDGFMGYQTVDGEQVFLTAMLYGDDFLYVAVPTAKIFDSRMSMAGLVTLTCLLVLLVLGALLVFSRSMQSYEPEAPKGARKTPHFFSIFSPSGNERVVQSASSRWNGIRVHWHDRTPEQRLSFLISRAVAVLAVVLVVYLMFFKDTMSKESILSFILSCEWERTPNLFSLTYSVFLMLEVIVVSAVVRRIILFASQQFGARCETIGRLLDNFIKYAAVIATLFSCLNSIGIDSSTLITSASILTIIVGLGSQSLIGDILAGIFIVFEGEFRVGDIVTIGDWRGTVLEIGIRTTKIESAGSDIKIFNNSTISGVINMTKQFSYAFADIGVEYGESLEHVESVLNKELPHIKEHLPAIVSGPFYKGVASLGDSSVNIRIVAQCKESDRVQLMRDLNRELKLIFDHHDISIPFPQIVLNQPSLHEKATSAEKREAKAFVEEQKELTRDIHVKEDE